MKLTKIILSIALAFTFSSCSGTAGNNAASNNANKSNNSTTPAEVEPSIVRTPPPENENVNNKVAAKTEEQETTERITIDGQLHFAKTGSHIFYVGKESGDFAAYCFANESEAGRAILAACKDGDQCEITGEVASDDKCNPPEYKGMLSGSAKIIKVKTVKKLTSKK
jgi:hypothetical protein